MFIYVFIPASPPLLDAGGRLRYDAAGGKGLFPLPADPGGGRRNLYKDPKRIPPGNTTQIFAKFKWGIDHRREIIGNFRPLKKGRSRIAAGGGDAENRRNPQTKPGAGGRKRRKAAGHKKSGNPNRQEGNPPEPLHY